MKKWRTLHKWIAVTAGLFLLTWLISGLVLALPFDTALPPDEPVELSELVLPPAQILARLGPAAQAQLLGIRRIAGRAVYEIRTPDHGVFLVDTRTGERVPITRELAEQIVRRRFPTTAPVMHAEHLSRHDWMYRSGALPVWRIILHEGADVSYYVSRTGDAQRFSRWRIAQLVMGKLHDFSALEVLFGNRGIAVALLYFGATVAIATALTGYYLALPRKR